MMAWRMSAVVFGGALVALLLLFWPTVVDMEATWRVSDSFRHTYVVPFVIAYLVWENREKLEGIAPRLAPIGLVAILIASGGWLLGEAANVQLVKQLGLVGMIQGLVLTLFGWRVVWVLLFPLLFLFFLVPVGEFLVPVLQRWTAEFLVWSVQLTGLPITTDGYLIQVSDGSQPYHFFTVEKECSGIRYLTAMFQIGLLASYLLFRSWPRRITVVLLSVAVPIVANWLRALGIVMLVYHTEGRHGQDVDHIIYGFWFFLFVLLVFVGFCWLLADATPPRRPAVPPRSGPSAPFPGIAAMAVAALVAAGLGPAYATYTQGRHIEDAHRLTEPAPAAGWRKTDYRGLDWHPVFYGADAELIARYIKGVESVDFYVAFYTHQRQGAELINSENDLAGDRWKDTGIDGTVTVETGRGPTELAYSRVVGRGRERLVFYGYWVDGRIVLDGRRAKFRSAGARLLGGEQASAVIAFALDYEGDVAQAQGQLQGFIDDLHPFGVLEQAVAR